MAETECYAQKANIQDNLKLTSTTIEEKLTVETVGLHCEEKSVIDKILLLLIVRLGLAYYHCYEWLRQQGRDRNMCPLWLATQIHLR